LELSFLNKVNKVCRVIFGENVLFVGGHFVFLDEMSQVKQLMVLELFEERKLFELEHHFFYGFLVLQHD
jgi:hypothetical protein